MYKCPVDHTELVGKTFGKLVVLKFTGHRGTLRYEVKCECGTVEDVEKYNLTSKKRECRNCIKLKFVNNNRDPKANMFLGKQYGDITVIGIVNLTKSLYLVECKCGRKEQARSGQLLNKRCCTVCLLKKRRTSSFKYHIYHLVKDYEQEIKDELKNSRNSRKASTKA